MILISPLRLCLYPWDLQIPALWDLCGYFMSSLEVNSSEAGQSITPSTKWWQQPQKTLDKVLLVPEWSCMCHGILCPLQRESLKVNQEEPWCQVRSGPHLLYWERIPYTTLTEESLGSQEGLLKPQKTVSTVEFVLIPGVSRLQHTMERVNYVKPLCVNFRNTLHIEK